MRATHGVSVSHRRPRLHRPAPGPGQGVQEQEDGRPPRPVETVTTQNLTVFRVDAERGLIMIKGAVPGAEGSYVEGARRGEEPGPRRRAQARAASASPARGVAEPPRRLRPPKPPAKEPRREAQRRQPRRRRRRRHRALGRDLRPDRDPRRHPGALRDLAAGQAPRRHAQDQDPERSRSDRQEDVQAEGHRRRPSRLAQGRAVRGRRQGARPGQPQPRLRPAQEGPGPGAAPRAVVQGQVRLADRDRRGHRSPSPRPPPSGLRSRSSAGRARW